jgi:Putative peptidoglycan binding domain
MAPAVPFMRTLYPPYAAKGPVPGGDDVIAIKRAISRAGFYPWRRFNNSYNDEFAKEGVKAFQKKVGLSASGVYGRATHDKLRNTRCKGKPNEWAFDPFSINLIKNAVERQKETTVLEKAREMLAFCRKFEGPYIYGGQHDGSFLDNDFRDGYDCSSSTSYVLWKFGLLGSTSPKVSSWFETWGEAGRGKYLTIHANGDHVWMEFSLPEGYFRFDTSPHGDGPRGPRVRTLPRGDSGFVHRHPKDM